jgi:hypothetical protein
MTKPLKVRILKSTLNDGGVSYTAQYRMMGMWFSFADTDTSIRKAVAQFFHDMLYDDEAPCPQSIWVCSEYCANTTDIEECKLLIKEYLDAVDVYNKNVASKTVKKTEVIKL